MQGSGNRSLFFCSGASSAAAEIDFFMNPVRFGLSFRYNEKRKKKEDEYERMDTRREVSCFDRSFRNL